ncbi:hypothetical protein DAI22_11g163900 [Oryza sativa Japonica Group]|nr:uncharacterized protein LOC9267751 [Oryza sativa Japonica Group]KAF2911263.1 hypothetical protein DAI22_11g163900 [Oryza sativa Japonica Group]
MLGFSTGQLVVILGACSLMMKRSDMIKIARVAGRMTGRAVGRLMLFRRQMDEILEQTAAKQDIHSEVPFRRPHSFFIDRLLLNYIPSYNQPADENFSSFAASLSLNKHVSMSCSESLFF